MTKDKEDNFVRVRVSSQVKRCRENFKNGTLGTKCVLFLVASYFTQFSVA